VLSYQAQALPPPSKAPHTSHAAQASTAAKPKQGRQPNPRGTDIDATVAAMQVNFMMCDSMLTPALVLVSL